MVVYLLHCCHQNRTNSYFIRHGPAPAFVPALASVRPLSKPLCECEMPGILSTSASFIATASHLIPWSLLVSRPHEPKNSFLDLNTVKSGLCQRLRMNVHWKQSRLQSTPFLTALYLFNCVLPLNWHWPLQWKVHSNLYLPTASVRGAIWQGSNWEARWTLEIKIVQQVQPRSWSYNRHNYVFFRAQRFNLAFVRRFWRGVMSI